MNWFSIANNIDMSLQHDWHVLKFLLMETYLLVFTTKLVIFSPPPVPEQNEDVL